MVLVLDRNNLVRALKQVQRNKGAAGVDVMTVGELPNFLKRHWLKIRQQLAEGTHQPKPVLRVEIPKPDGRKRKLGIPTVLDRLIQQAIVKQLSRRTRGHSVIQIIAKLRKSLPGWKAYFDIAEILSPPQDLDKWIRRRLRCYIWKQWGRKGYRMLRRLGVERWLAWNTAKSAQGPWRLSGNPALRYALPNRYFRNLGLPELAAG